METLFEFRVLSLDKDLSPGVAMLSFGEKSPIAVHHSIFIYRMTSDILSEPSIQEPQIYEAGIKFGAIDRWAVSRNLQSVINWITENQ